MRLFGWFSRLIIQSVFIGGVSFVTTWMIIDLYIDKLLEQFPLEQVDARIKPIDLLDHILSNQANVNDDEIDWKNDVNKENEEITRGEGAHDDAESPDHESDPVQYVPSHGAIPVWGREDAGLEGRINPDLEVDLEADLNADASVGEQEQEHEHEHERNREQTDTLAMSAEEFNRKKEEMSEEDKAAVFSLLVTRVPQEILLKMSVLLEDGLTHEELREIEEMIVEVLTEEEIEQLFEIIDKY